MLVGTVGITVVLGKPPKDSIVTLAICSLTNSSVAKPSGLFLIKSTAFSSVYDQSA
jgi:hypothetical protein